MLLVALLCQILADDPADALRPVNRSEITMLAERLAALESAVAERDAKIIGIERRLREMDHQQSIHCRAPYRPKVVRDFGDEEPRWKFRWLQTSVRWRSDGEFELQEPESLGTLEPQPHRIRGILNYYYDGDYGPTMKIGAGTEIAEFWIAPPFDHSVSPLELGLVLGMEQLLLPPDEQSIIEAINKLSRINHESDLDRSIGRNAY